MEIRVDERLREKLRDGEWHIVEYATILPDGKPAYVRDRAKLIWVDGIKVEKAETS